MLGLRTVRGLRGLRQVTHQALVEQVRYRSKLPLNTIVLFVPQQEAWIIERFGKFHRILDPGLNVLLPVVDSIKYVQSLKEIAIGIPQQSAISADNVALRIDGVLYLRIVEPFKASYGVEDVEFAITQIAQTTMRSELGKISLDTLFRERESLNVNIVRDIQLPERIQEAMQMQVEAERKKRAAVLESEGIREADINVAEGQKRAKILASEAFKTEQVNQALGEAEALVAMAKARATSIDVVSQSLSKKNGHNAVSMSVAEQYIEAFGKLAKNTNTVLLPSNTGDITSMVSQAMTIYKTLNVEKPHILPEHQEDPTVREKTGVNISEFINEPRVSDFYDETDVMKSKDKKDHH